MAYVAFLLFLIAFISTTAVTIDVQFLGEAPRLNNSMHWDCYFFCNAFGPTLQWRVNGDGGLGGFVGVGDLASVLASKGSNFNYTATLLSVQNIKERQYSYDSVLVVSSTRRISLNVICTNGLIRSSVNNSEEKDSIIDSVSNNNVNLQYLISRPILNKTVTNNFTRIFICGVNYPLIHWVTNTSDYTYEFSTDSNFIGDSINYTRAGDTVVTQQAILMCLAPYTLVSIFFATGNEDITVTCGYAQNEVHLTSSLFGSMMTRITLELSESTTSRDGLLAATSTETSLCDSYSHCTITTSMRKKFFEKHLPVEVIVLPVAIVSLTICSIPVLVVICVYCHFKKRCTCACGYGGNPDEENAHKNCCEKKVQSADIKTSCSSVSTNGRQSDSLDPPDMSCMVLKSDLH